MVLFPEGTVRRYVFENFLDRPLGWLFYGQFRTLSSIWGDQLKAGTPDWGARNICPLLSKIEPCHCERNAGRP